MVRIVLIVAFTIDFLVACLVAGIYIGSEQPWGMDASVSVVLVPIIAGALWVVVNDRWLP